ncbi:DUF4434 domain-containing protein [Aquibaculum arenosum]|uniref:DUF4434 domain-containing protein n=1 Tax=Aquibaculum arenosum TaxID=3032591 RepID=A0ABT5YP82_9PROT|nr:DUF4434 domain-containing protein [Fodinicurvata sp. CAU 1616]MDF2096642.1 DUF4434 domain-containing protein [Fodinicurvata sp. CAU 1616]
MHGLLPLLFLLLLAAALPAKAGCPAPPQGSFLQLYLDQGPPWEHTSAQALQRWKALGAQEIVLQWSAHGSPGDERFALIERGAVQALLEAGAQAGVRIRLGLRYDPGLWDPRNHDEGRSADGHTTVTAPPSELETYLARRLRDQEALVAALGPFANHLAFAGWYIADEIDDRNWTSPARRAVLNDYLADVADLLHSVAPGVDIAISGFSTGWMPPQEWAAFWTDLLTATGIDRLYFQDGIGAGHLEMTELPHYLPPLAEGLQQAGHGLSVVVELFGAGGQDEAFGPADPERVMQQLALAAVTRAPTVSFALPHYADSEEGPRAARLAAALAELTANCPARSKAQHENQDQPGR